MSPTPSRRRRLGVRAATVAVPLALLSPALPSNPALAHSGHPGVASDDPTVVFIEDFENDLDSVDFLGLRDYVNAAGGSYEATDYWASPVMCNGLVLRRVFDGAASTPCSSETQVRRMAQALGVIDGQEAPGRNHAVAAYTNAPTPALPLAPGDIQFETTTDIELPSALSGRFLTFSVDGAALNCTSTHPLFDFALRDDGTEIPVNNAPLDPCTDPRRTTVTVDGNGITAGRFTSDRAILFSGDSFGIVMRNANGSPAGNDGAFDNIRVLDATPQLDKAFSTGAQSGGTSTLTFTVTNTSDLGAKEGWSFTDELADGLTVAEDPALTTDCAGVDADVDPGGSTITVEGSLETGDVSCTIAVDVTAVGGEYANGPDDITSSTGLNLPDGDAVVRFNKPPTVTIDGPTDGGTYFQGQDVPVAYSCADPDGAVASCDGSQTNGSKVDTSTPGNGSLTVTGTDDEGATATRTVTYQVVPVAGVCRGTPLSLLGLAPGTANGATTPCVTGHGKVLTLAVTITPAIPLLGIPANSVSVGALTGDTQSAPDAPAGAARAQAEVASVSISILGTSIKATGLTSAAASQLVSCSAPAVVTGTSSVASLTINGKPVANLSQPLSIPLGIGTLGINERGVVGNTITQSAFHLNVAGLVDLALGQSVAGASC